ncbi:hypothetical protein CHELA40_30271 [Chelatococcus asaccharovorans]|nr:hypothetical protein CHELA17_40144 [Chelatococcus asaccharovorans]CAH1688647.1 hypothetical protein CHELA40_30271 [Chelatococcus asaccharovorans]
MCYYHLSKNGNNTSGGPYPELLDPDAERALPFGEVHYPMFLRQKNLSGNGPSIQAGGA